MSGGAKLEVKVAEVVEVNELIKRFRFVSRDGAALPAFSGGSHVVVEMDDHGTRRLNPYSLMSDPAETSGYEISVRRDDAGRGGSLFLHNHVRAGDAMVLSHPLNFFALDTRAKKHLMIAGGIGISGRAPHPPQRLAAGRGQFLDLLGRKLGLAGYPGPFLFGLGFAGKSTDLHRLAGG
jgi:NAD(P)H-flavin reductase